MYKLYKMQKIKIVLKKCVKMFLEIKNIFVIVKSFGKTFVLEEIKRYYPEELKKKQ